MATGRRYVSKIPACAYLGFARAFYHDLTEKRGKDEFSMYYYFDQAGPCQNAAWPDMWKIFAKRLGVENALFQAFPGVANNFLGQGYLFGYEPFSVIYFTKRKILSGVWPETKMKHSRHSPLRPQRSWRA